MVSFSKKLRDTDVNSRFSWPTSQLNLLHHPPFQGGRVHFTAVDARGRVWDFTCSVRTRGRYLKPVLDGSTWLPFVRANKLALGDVVVFCRPAGAVRFTVRVRKIKTVVLFGQRISAYAIQD